MTLLNTYAPTRANRYQTLDAGQYFALPPANIAEEEKNFRIELAVPGYSKSDFNIELDKDLLNVSMKEQEQEQKQDNAKDHQEGSGYIKREFGFEGFCRSFRLSDQVDKQNIRAKYENGLLMITIPKKKESINRSIDIS